MKNILSLVLACIMLVSCMTAVFADETKVEATFIYVAESGDDAAAGSVDAPLKTIAAAVKKAEGIDGTVVINLRSGAYQMTETVTLSEANSDLVIRSYPGEEVLVTGGTVLPYSAFKPCTDEAFLNALSTKSVKDKVVSANIKDLGVTDLGEIQRQGFASGGGKTGYAPTLTYNDEALTIARYPNEGYLYTSDVIRDGSDSKVYFDSDDAIQIEVKVDDTRYQKWAKGGDIWCVAYWMHDWADSTVPVELTDNNTIISYTAHYYNPVANRRLYFFNVPEELDKPGEWYLDRETGMLYMIPVDGMKSTDTLVFNSYKNNFFTLNGAKNVSFTGIKFNGTCAKAIEAIGCDGIVIDDCEFTGIGDVAVRFEKCYRSGVKNSYFHDLGSWGVYTQNCGDRRTLTPSECFITNCHFRTFSQYRRTYSPAVHIDFDVGTVVSNCEFHDAPHFAIRYEGNDIVIENSEFYDVCQDTADTGAVYTGRRWDTRGNELRYNYFHDMTAVETTTGMEKMAVYLDDCSSSTNVHGNVFYKVDSVALMGGGRYNQFTNNIMIDCNKPLVFDERGITWQYTQGWLTKDTGAIYTHVKELPYNEGIWAEKYPELSNLFEDDPVYPKHNTLKNNVLYRTPEFSIAPTVQEYGTIENNIEISKTNNFVDYRNKNFALSEDSEVFTKLPEFENIPFDKIGRYDYTVEDKYVEKASAVTPSAPADDTIKVLLNGTAIDFADVAPQIINDRTMVPLRAIFEALGATVEWDDATKTVTAVKGDVTIKMTIGASEFTRNNEKVALDSPATIVDSRTLVPVRAIAESFGSEVGWIAESKTVTITD